MREAKQSKWRKLDNAAQAFPAATGKKDTRVFRFYCQLTDEVREECLQKAAEQTIEKYPLYRSVLRKGVFWFYMEQRNLPVKVKKEERPPCSKLYVPDQKSLLFEVSYYHNRINFEVFHGLTDGTGAMLFLKELVSNYLRARYPGEKFPAITEEKEITFSDLEEDSFSQYYSGKKGSPRKKARSSCQLRGEKREQWEMSIVELLLSTEDVHRKAKEYGVSITVFLAAVLLYAIYEEIPKSRIRKPITLMIPVNLRNYFPSSSMTNFFGWIEAGYQFERTTAMQDVIRHLKTVFEEELVKEKIEDKMSELVRLEKNPLLRAVPLEIKNLFLLAGTTLGGRSITAIYSNIGRVEMAPEYDRYIKRFGFFTSTDKLQLCSCSYGDEMSLAFTSKLLSESIQRNFARILREEGIKVREEKNEFPGHAEDAAQKEKLGIKIFTFVCGAAIILFWMLNFLLPPDFLGAGYSTAGIFCVWMFVMVGYKKRRNILKNGMWQLLIVSIAAVLWDIFTGWYGWSVDFVIPLASLVTLISLFVVSRVCRLESDEYLFYLVQASAFGCLPAILFLAGVVGNHYPSVICSGISILFLLGLGIFKGKELMQEVRKKFRM